MFQSSLLVLASSALRPLCHSQESDHTCASTAARHTWACLTLTNTGKLPTPATGPSSAPSVASVTRPRTSSTTTRAPTEVSVIRTDQHTNSSPSLPLHLISNVYTLFPQSMDLFNTSFQYKVKTSLKLTFIEKCTQSTVSHEMYNYCCANDLKNYIKTENKNYESCKSIFLSHVCSLNFFLILHDVPSMPNFSLQSHIWLCSWDTQGFTSF